MIQALRVRSRLIAILACASAVGHAAEDATWKDEATWLHPYRPTTFTYTFDSDDDPFIDGTVSFKFPILEKTLERWSRGMHTLSTGFTGRFGFYMGSRKSGPVIGKRFNPDLLIYRMAMRDAELPFGCEPEDTEPVGPEFQDPVAFQLRVEATERAMSPGIAFASAGCDSYAYTGYVEVTYSHESNGQPITSLSELEDAQDRAQAAGDSRQSANDFISRGWDYIGVTVRLPGCEACEGNTHRLSSYFSGRYYLNRGLLQGRAEDLLAGEELLPGSRARREVSGLSALLKLEAKPCEILLDRPCDNVGHLKLSAGYETGIGKPFRNSTWRAEAGLHLGGLPWVVWWQTGFGSDIAQYYKKVESFGVGVEFGSF